jgi:hypothetical protein
LEWQYSGGLNAAMFSKLQQNVTPNFLAPQFSAEKRNRQGGTK